jgi:hypothetical protein
LKYRRVRMTPEVMQALDQQREAFIKQFGREPRPEGPTLYDENCDVPTPLFEDQIEELMLNALAQAGHPARNHLCLPENGPSGH